MTVVTGNLAMRSGRTKLTTYMGCFGHDLMKCSHLMVNFRTGVGIDVRQD